MECEQTMSDNAHIVREALRTAAMIEETYRDALAALDALVSERDEARELVDRCRKFHTATEKDRVTAEAEVARLNNVVRQLRAQAASSVRRTYQ